MALYKYHYIELDTKRSPRISLQNIVAGETGNVFWITFSNNNEIVDMSEKSDGEFLYRVSLRIRSNLGVRRQDSDDPDGGITFIEAQTGDHGKIHILLSADAYTSGKNRCVLEIYSKRVEEDDTLICSAEWTFDAEENPTGENKGLVYPMMAYYEQLAKSWATGGTGKREGEDTDNAKYYKELAEQAVQGGIIDPTFATWLTAHMSEFLTAISGDTDEWLSEHISNPSNPPLDTSLSLANAAAPANLLGYFAHIAVGSEYYRINTSGHIQLKAEGNTQGTTPTASATYSCIVLPVKKGDSVTLYLAPDTSATSYKGYVFTDSDYVSVERQPIGDTLIGAELIAPENGYFIANAPATSESFVIKNGVFAMQTISALSSHAADLYSKLGAGKDLTATTESNKVYKPDVPYGTTANNYMARSYAVTGGDVLSISVDPLPSSTRYKLAMWYDKSGNYLGCIDRVGSSSAQYNVPVIVPSRAATLRISTVNSATVSVKKMIIPAQTQKSVSMAGDVITIVNDKYTYVMSKHGNNNLMDLYRVLAKDGTILYTASTDWQGPYTVSAIDNADGDAIAQGATYTGGNHAYAFDGGSGTPTARTSAFKVYADGVELADGQALSWNDCVSVEWTNYVQGWNTKKSDGTGREILMESPVWRFRPGDRIETENRIEALEDIRIGLYYGLQMAAAWLGGGVLLPSAKRTVIPMSEFTPTAQGGIGTRFAGYNVTALGTGINITMGYDPLVDIGDGNAITSDEIKLTRIHTSTSKCYVYMVYNYDLDDDETMRYAGYYQFR